ncbi:TVP38/TMEM64 family protein [Alkalicoccus chagannorensis]|uniref:TVP38/TMEM64 family protein n=1 Tax=Alkalicoccus chagannorensis TaxID=427072 RepID=UPI00040B48F8|nr:VTT domain-containing protein [Alkalicoccus chagannorensis]
MKRSISTLCALALGIFLLTQWDVISELRSENVSYLLEELLPSYGYVLLFLTIPLLIAQNIFTVFPVIIVILFHFIAFGPIEGFLYSWAGTAAGSMVCFFLGRSWLENWALQFWEKQEGRWKRAAETMSAHGVLSMIVLRSIPVMPSNLISIGAALSPMTVRIYTAGTILGNMSMIFVLALLVSPVWSSSIQELLIFSAAFGVFLMMLLLYYLYQRRGVT